MKASLHQTSFMNPYPLISALFHLQVEYLKREPQAVREASARAYIFEPDAELHKVCGDMCAHARHHGVGPEQSHAPHCVDETRGGESIDDRAARDVDEDDARALGAY